MTTPTRPSTEPTSLTHWGISESFCKRPASAKSQRQAIAGLWPSARSSSPIFPITAPVWRTRTVDSAAPRTFRALREAEDVYRRALEFLEKLTGRVPYLPCLPEAIGCLASSASRFA